ncbi:MAG TPA: EamA family transporter [Chitinophagaceae bacterium]|nr:EamA family transporter [Chitinophagaceae bacterium]
MKPEAKAHIAVVSTNLFFAVNFSLVKYVSPALIKPYAVNILRVGVSLILFWLLWTMSDVKPHIKRKHWFRFFLCGLTGIAINQMFFIKGLTYTSAIHASLLILLTPILITVFAFTVLKEKITIIKALGLALGIGGAVLLILSKEQSSSATDYLFGDLLIVINAISYTVYFIIVKPLMAEYPPLHVVRWVFTFGFLMILPFGWNEFVSIPWEQLEWSHYLSILFIVVPGTFLAYFFNIYGIQHLGAGTTGSYIYTQPVFAAVIAVIIFHEQLTPAKLLAGIMIFLGVFLVSFKRGSLNKSLGVIEE